LGKSVVVEPKLNSAVFRPHDGSEHWVPQISERAPERSSTKGKPYLRGERGEHGQLLERRSFLSPHGDDLLRELREGLNATWAAMAG
jgi:hypothetical protein